jgi:prepilin-type N-terminal cleavage/methylation domain-containing protein/prepilin-type processing-associated H-X9-DG protein
MNYHKSQREAFTLVELLVAIAIVGVLASFLFTVFANTRENARRTTCSSNLKQIGTAALMYVQDCDGRFMPVVNEGEPPVGTQTPFWFRLLQPYSKNTQVFKCPSDDTGTFTNYGGHASYGYNVHIGGAAMPSLLPPGVDASNKTESEIARAANTVMITDSGTNPIGSVPGIAPLAPENWFGMTPCPAEIGDAAVVNPTPTPGPTPVIANLPVGAFPAPRARHQGRTNVLWTDGHITSATIESFYVPPGVTAPGETVPGYSPCLRPEKGCP